MKEVTCWKVFRTVSTTGVQRTVLVGLDPSIMQGIVREVTDVKTREINGYKLVGKNNDHFNDFLQVWAAWTTANDVNSITDISDQYE